MASVRIVKYPWHTGHDYELSKIGAEVYFYVGTHRRWSSNQRPLPANVRLTTDIASVEADVMMLHLDQWSWDELDKRQLFLYHRDTFDRKIVVINHGCNLVDGCSSERMRQMVGNLPVVCNSGTARSLWGMENSAYLRHGMSPSEWPASNYGRINIVVTQPFSSIHSECRNGDAVLRFESRTSIGVDWVGRNRRFDNYFKYKAFLASSLIFFNPSYASANPRARTEAMLCGLAVVTTNMHGESDYIVNGENGFASNDMEELFEWLVWLHRNPKEARRIGVNGRRTAQDVFSIDRFVRRWDIVLDHVISGRRIGGLDLQALA
jgi:hypothetical protein